MNKFSSLTGMSLKDRLTRSRKLIARASIAGAILAATIAMCRCGGAIALLGASQTVPAFAESKDKACPPAAKAPAERERRSESSKASLDKAKARAASVAALCAKLGLGQGAVIADIGAGKGQDSWVFAERVGPSGTVYALEVTEKLTKSLEEEVKKRGLAQVHVVQGRDEDSGLPHDCLDLAYMHNVYHHLSMPREILRGVWRALRPGGYLVVVDRNRGTLRDWVPRQQRKEKHFWLAETTVVRESREEGFAFVGLAEECWEPQEPFVLVFQRPKDQKEPGRDPDGFLPLAEKDGFRRLLPLGAPYRQPVFVALGEARSWIGPILQCSSGPGLEIVLEEWATQKDERSPLPAEVFLPSILTDNGDPHLVDKQIDVVFFLDSYHLLFHGKTLLAKLRERLAPGGCVYIVDRDAKQPLSRREASHRRQIGPDVVKQEMAEAGLVLWSEGPRLAPDRFLLLFGKTKPEELTPEADPLLGGPEIGDSPGTWLKDNGWRLRGLKTADGKLIRLAHPGQPAAAERVKTAACDTEAWKLPRLNLLLMFRRTATGYVIEESQSLASPK